jgi:hypothetical protein
MMHAIAGFIFLLVATVLPSRPHPIHVSVSDVSVSAARIEWTTRIYTDDLLLGVYGKHVSPGRIGDMEDIRRDVLRYLTRHIKAGPGQSPVKWTINSIDHDLEAVSVTLTAALDPASSMDWIVGNSTLTDVYADQKNIVNISMDGKTMNMLFEKGDTPRPLRH